MNGDRFLQFLVMVFVAVGITRIVSTYGVFNQFYDEAFTVTCGVKWVAGDTTCDPKHPPLGRALPGLALWLDGARPQYLGDIAAEANTILGKGAAYWRRLAIARAGSLPFFALACWAVWLWAKWIAGTRAAACAVLLFSSLPAILGHGGIAMSDIALAGTLGLALYALCRWIEEPTVRRSIWFGASSGLAIVSNFSALPLMCAAAAMLVLVRWSCPRIAWRPTVAGIFAAALCIWAGFHFSVTRLPADSEGRHPVIDQVVGSSGALHTAAYAAANVPLPAPYFVTGLYLLSVHNRADDMWNAFAGDRRSTGWWYFYPVALAGKTPIGFLVLFALGLAFAVRGSSEDRSLQDRWLRMAAPAAIVGLLAAGMLSHVNTSIRHLLPIYVPAAVVAGFGLWRAWSAGWALRAIAGAALAWHLISSAAAHPDYFAYLNEAGRRAPEWFGVGDLDYGQDLKRLGEACSRRGVGSLWIAHLGTADPGQLLPPSTPLPPRQPVTGWIAISLNPLRLGVPDDLDAYAWLRNLEPVERVGSSILLYHADILSHTASNK